MNEREKNRVKELFEKSKFFGVSLGLIFTLIMVMPLVVDLLQLSDKIEVKASGIVQTIEASLDGSYVINHDVAVPTLIAKSGELLKVGDEFSFYFQNDKRVLDNKIITAESFAQTLRRELLLLLFFLLGIWFLCGSFIGYAYCILLMGKNKSEQLSIA